MPPSDSTPFIDQARQHQIAVLGECMIELSGKPLSPLKQAFSGDTLNTAIYLKRLTADLALDLHYATALGQDAFSKSMLEQWKNEGINCDYIAQLPNKNPGIYFIEVDSDGERHFSYWRNDSAAKLYLELETSFTLLKAIANFDLLYISGISLAILPPSSRVKLLLAIKQMRSNGGKLVFDNNYRPLLWLDKSETIQTYNEFMGECDIALLTLDDEIALRGMVAAQNILSYCLDMGIEETVIKRGAEPCWIQIAKNKKIVNQFEIAATQVQNVVDTTAAGDSFSGAYLAARLHNLPPKKAAQWGHQLAGKVIQHPGAIIPKSCMPTMLEHPQENIE